MKKKKSIIIISTIMLIIIIVGIGLYIISRSKPNLKAHEISNIKESSEKIPPFLIAIGGNYDGIINNTFLEEDKIPMYEFDAAIETTWGTFTNKYIGVKLNDLLEKYQITNYKSIEFVSNDFVRAEYKPFMITDNMYIVFYRDGKLIDEDNAATLISIDRNYRYAVERLSQIYFYNDEQSKPIENNNDDNENSNNEENKDNDKTENE